MSEVDVAALKEAVERTHGGRTIFKDIASVLETFHGQPVWEGIVYIFELRDHPTANVCYVCLVFASRNRETMGIWLFELSDHLQHVVIWGSSTITQKGLFERSGEQMTSHFDAGGINWKKLAGIVLLLGRKK